MKKKPLKSSRVERRKRLKRRAEDLLPDFRDLIENSVQGILVHRNFKPLYANETFASVFGYASAKEIMAMPLLRPLVPPDSWARVEQEYDDLIRGRRKAIASRVRGIRKDGSEIWAAMTERLIDWHGTPAVQANVYDISAQMAIEQSLLKSEQHLRSILEILPYPIYIARQEDGQLLFVNRKTCLLFQQSAGQLLRGRSIDFFVNPQEREEMRKLLETIPDIRDVEVNMKTAAGREFVAEVAAIAVEYGGTPSVLVALNDISQRKELEAELFKQASTDGLTGISNRRYFMAQAEQELRRSRRFARDMAVMMIDIDHFKKINDSHGHAAGRRHLARRRQTFARKLAAIGFHRAHRRRRVRRDLAGNQPRGGDRSGRASAPAYGGTAGRGRARRHSLHGQRRRVAQLNGKDGSDRRPAPPRRRSAL